MPEVRTRGSAKSRKKSAPTEEAAFQRPTVGDARDLIRQMLDYEAAARQRGIDFAAGRFRKLTASERQFLRAELIADYIKLSARNIGDEPAYYDATLTSFCSKICDMAIPSQELIGTYLAAVDVVSEEPYLKKIPPLNESVRRTMVSVLETCVELMRKKSERTAKVSA